MSEFNNMSYTKKNIILDMDGTLLDADVYSTNFRKQKPIARPHLKKFLEYVFETFENVSIWTNATESWYNQCYEEVLKHHLPEGKTFHFVRHREHNMGRVWIHKKLTDIYELYPEIYNIYNTLIVDDNCETYALNAENAVPINPFFYDLIHPKEHSRLDEYDKELLRIIEELKNDEY